MRTIIISILSTLLLAFTVLAQEDTQEKIKCSGTWTLINESGWVVRSKEGTVLPLSYNTEIIGCSKKSIKLNHKHSGRSVAIFCQPSKIEHGLPDITKVIIICK